MTRDSSFQKSLNSSSIGSNSSSPRNDVATVWRRSEESKPMHSSLPDSQKDTALHKNVTFDSTVKDSLAKNKNLHTSDDEISEEELLRKGIHLARRLSTDGPRREFNWDEEDDDTPWSEMPKSPLFPIGTTSSSSTAIPATSTVAPNLYGNEPTSSSSFSQSNKPLANPLTSPSTLSPAKKPIGAHKSVDSFSSSPPQTWKIPSQFHHVVPIPKQIQELNDKKQQQQHHTHRHSYSNPHNSLDSNRSSMMDWNHRGGSHNDFVSDHVENRYRYNDYDKRYRPEQSTTLNSELFNENSGQFEAYHHRNRGGRVGPSGAILSRGMHTIEGVSAIGTLETHEPTNTVFSTQNTSAHSSQQMSQQSRTNLDYQSYRRDSHGSPSSKYAAPDYSIESSQHPKSLLEVQEELMRISRENALKRKEEEARAEKERLEAIRKKNEERLAKLEAKKIQEPQENTNTHKQEMTQLQTATTETRVGQEHQYDKRGDDGKHGIPAGSNGPHSVYHSNKPGRDSNVSADDNTAIQTVNSLIGNENSGQHQSKPKLWTNSSSVANSGINTHTRSSQSYSNLSGANPPLTGSSTAPIQGHGHHNSTSSTNRSVSTQLPAGRGQHGCNNNSQGDIWGSSHGQIPPASDGEFWRPFSTGLQNIQGNVYPPDTGISQSPSVDHHPDFPQQVLPTSTSAAPTHRMLPSWGNINSPSSSTSNNSANTTNTTPNTSSSGKNMYDQSVYIKQTETQGSWANSHTQSQRSVSMPSSPMSSIHSSSHQRQAHHSVSENGSSAKLIGVRSSIHDPPSMSRGISRFFPMVGNEDKENSQQRSSVEPMTTITSSANIHINASASNSSTATTSPIRHSSSLSLPGLNNPISKSGYGHQQHTSQLPNVAAHLNGPAQISNITPPRSAHSNSIITSMPNSHSMIMSNDDGSYMSSFVFPSQAIPPNYVGNMAFSSSAMGPNSIAYSPNITDGSLFGDIAQSPISPRISLPPSRPHKPNESMYPLGPTHHRNLSHGPVSQAPKMHGQQFKSLAPSINSIQALQTTIAEKLGSKKTTTHVLQNETANNKNIAANMPKDLPIPVSPIVLSENIPPFSMTEQNKDHSMDKIFALQAQGDGMQTFDLPNNYHFQAANQYKLKDVAELRLVDSLGKNHSFADTVALSLEAGKRKQAATSAKRSPATVLATVPISSTNPVLCDESGNSKLQDKNLETQESSFKTLINFSDELVTQSAISEFDSLFSELTEIKNTKIPISVPSFKSSKQDTDIQNDTQSSASHDISKDWENELATPPDEALCTLFFWSPGQATAYNREFKPRTTSRVALLIPGNTQKILTLYRISNLESLTSAPGNGMSLREMEEKSRAASVSNKACAAGESSCGSAATNAPASTGKGEKPEKKGSRHLKSGSTNSIDELGKNVVPAPEVDDTKNKLGRGKSVSSSKPGPAALQSCHRRIPSTNSKGHGKPRKGSSAASTRAVSTASV